MPWIELISRSTRHQVRSGTPGISEARSPGRPPSSYGPLEGGASAPRCTIDADRRLEDKQPGHGPPHRAPADRTLGHCRSWSTTADDPHDRRPSSQREVHVGQDTRPGTRHYRSRSRRSPSHRPTATRGCAEAQQQRDRSAPYAGPCVGGSSPAVERVRMAQPVPRRRPCADLFRRARGSSPRSDHLGGPSDGPPLTAGDDGRVVAMEDGRGEGASGAMKRE